MDAVVEQLTEVAPAALSDLPIAFAYVFGSHATGRATPRSDIDVAVGLAPDVPADLDTLQLRLDVAGRLEQALGAGPVEVVVVDEAPLPLAGRIAEHGVPIASRDEVLRVRWVTGTRARYHDFKPLERRVARAKLAILAGRDDG